MRKGNALFWTVMLVVGAVVLVIGGLLIWQARVRPYTAEELFVLPSDDALPMQDEEGRPRIIDMDGATNLRDLGGYTTTRGEQVRWRQVFRSARLLDLTDADLQRLRDLNIRTVCDLRQSTEAQAFPDRLPDDITYHSIPVFEHVPISPLRVAFNRHRLLDLFSDVYINDIVERGGEAYGKLFRLIADPDNLPLIFHCTGGKDRTGIAAVLLLRALGVPRETVIDDYLLTNRSADVFIEEVGDQLGARNLRGIDVEQLYPLLAASPRLVNRALDHISEAYGGARPYLAQKANLDDVTLAHLRDALLQ